MRNCGTQNQSRLLCTICEIAGKLNLTFLSVSQSLEMILFQVKDLVSMPQTRKV